jgi:acylpyruvate hydrolase
MKIFCIGRNYADHAKELNNAVPTEPLIFMKPPSALLRENKPFYYPSFTKDLHYEAEIVLRVNRVGKCIEEKFAHKYYDKITLGIDFTARDLQDKLKAKGHPWEIAKGFDGAAVIGEWIDWQADFRQNIPFHFTKNGTTVQVGNTRDLIFSFDYLIHYVSQFFSLSVGDLIYTGTPAGVGAVQIGDKLQGYIADTLLTTCEIK